MLGGIAERFLSAGQEHSNVGYAYVGLDISDFPTRHNYVLALWQSDFERILAEWVAELGVPILRRCEVMGFAQDDSGVDVGLSDGTSLRAEYFVGCDGGRSVSRQAASYRHGRVLLAGDAAHGHSPQGGQGLNTGVQDAVNLGWKLAQVVNRTSPECLLDSYHAERHPVGARVLHNTMAQVALSSPDDRHKALLATMTEVLSMDEPRRRIAGMISGLDIHYDLGDGHPLLGRRVPDLDVHTAEGPTRVFTLLHDTRPVLLNFGAPGGFDISPWASRVRLVDATHDGV